MPQRACSEGYANDGPGWIRIARQIQDVEYWEQADNSSSEETVALGAPSDDAAFCGAREA
jgi:hypothetical protein